MAVILGALEYATWTRDVRDGQVIHHSDRGSNHTSSILRVDRKSWRTIDGRYNTERIQARLGWLAPAEYEAAWHARQVVLHDHPVPDNTGVDPTPAR